MLWKLTRTPWPWLLLGTLSSNSAPCTLAYPHPLPWAWQSFSTPGEVWFWALARVFELPGGWTRCWLPGQLVSYAVFWYPSAWPGQSEALFLDCLCKNWTWSEGQGRLYLAAPGPLKGRGARLETSWKRNMGRLYLIILLGGPWGSWIWGLWSNWGGKPFIKTTPGWGLTLGQPFREALSLWLGWLITLALVPEKGGAVLWCGLPPWWTCSRARANGRNTWHAGHLSIRERLLSVQAHVSPSWWRNLLVQNNVYSWFVVSKVLHR